MPELFIDRAAGIGDTVFRYEIAITRLLDERDTLRVRFRLKSPQMTFGARDAFKCGD